MKHKTEKPDNTRPQLWMAYGPDDVERIRILYPNGVTEWNDTWLLTYGFAWSNLPCWQSNLIPMPMKIPSFPKRVKLMRAYDKARGAKTIFLGNI